MSKEEKQSSPEPFTPEERAQIRSMLERERAWKWVWHSTRNIAMWIAAVVAAIVLLWDSAVRLLRGMVQ